MTNFQRSFEYAKGYDPGRRVITPVSQLSTSVVGLTGRDVNDGGHRHNLSSRTVTAD